MEQYHKAVFIIQTLQEAGFIAYFAGGWVRDFLLGHPSDDIDIATNATPKEVQALFPKTIPVGISFGILLVLIDDHPFEVATFRKESDYVDGRHPSHIEFSDAVQDAQRRDFTINGMFFDPIKKELFDFVEGQKDLKKKIIRAIGDPLLRFKEDRLRMVRAVRLSVRFDFTIEKKTLAAIRSFAPELLPAVAVERIWQELVKMNLFPHFKEGLMALFDLDLLATIFPSLKVLPRKEIEKRLSILDNFPKNAPLIAKLLELFPSLSLEKQLDLCHFLKLSNREMEFVLLLDEGKRILRHPQDLFIWAHFYAKEESDLALEILAAHFSPDERSLFLRQNNERKKSLEKAILRIQKKDPVVKSHHLKEMGVLPGKEMGILLKEAEKIAIENRLEDPQKILKQLKESSLWPKK